MFSQRWLECITPKIGPATPPDEIEKKEKDDDSIEAQKNITHPPAYDEIDQNGVENPAFVTEEKEEQKTSL